MNLSHFQKPSRYIDSEYNAFKPGSGAGQRASRVARFALAFPDIYDVGMSHLGLRILYDILNRLPYAAAERAFAPWIDLEAAMKSGGGVLSSLESKTPLHAFDAVGFSLQYELSYTTVLNMLHMGGIPLRAEERLQSKRLVPLVIAGGPCTINPAPLAPFIDAFLIGDGEEAVVELAQTVSAWKESDGNNREAALRAIAEIEGFYVPLVHGPGGQRARVRRRYVADLDSAPYPVRPIVPYTSIVHDRITIEVSRGCTRGCRFCQAGMIYRPLRERSAARVLEIAEASLRATGHDEVSLSSLSAGDYGCLLPVVREFNRRHGPSKIALSLPSLRVAAIDQQVLREIRSIRKTGFTMAPEAATERLRSVINKDFTAEDYEKALRALFEEGWLTLKLYFMIGLPTERDEDIEAIKEMIGQALRIAKKHTGRFVTINTTISPFVPKAHTPFQWCGQISRDDMRRKLQYLREELSSKKFKYKGHDDRMSFLEAVFARGDERLAPLIEKAWRLGCRLDGWSEVFDFDRWREAMDATGVDAAAYAERRFTKDDALPWDGIDIGVTKEFLYGEYERALAEERSPDCGQSCLGCGLQCAGAEQLKGDTPAPEAAPLASASPSIGKVRIRVRFSKSPLLRYLSHLELTTALIRGLRRAEVRFDFSKGFHPTPKISFGPSLSTGVAGDREYFDMEVFTPFDIESHMPKIRATMPEGIEIRQMALIPVQAPSLSTFVTRYDYTVAIERKRAASAAAAVASALKQVRDGAALMVRREDKTVDVAPCIEEAAFGVHDEKDGGEDGDTRLRLVLRDYDTVKARVGEIAEAVTGIAARDLVITRTALYGWKDNGWVEPL